MYAFDLKFSLYCNCVHFTNCKFMFSLSTFLLTNFKFLKYPSNINLIFARKDFVKEFGNPAQTN
jgi:hypothetical protein